MTQMMRRLSRSTTSVTVKKVSMTLFNCSSCQSLPKNSRYHSRSVGPNDYTHAWTIIRATSIIILLSWGFKKIAIYTA